MEGGRVYGGSDMTVILQNDRLPCSSNVLDSLWISNSSTSFQDDSGSCSTSMVNFEYFRGGNQTNRPFFPPIEKEENDNYEDYGGSFHQPEKNRRLTADQVQFLERNFEAENKLEPERKVQLAKELGLQPRQVAIWFQNKRARFKAKQLEKDYDALMANYGKLKTDHGNLLKERERLRDEVRLLANKLLLSEKESTNSEPARSIHSMAAEPQKQIPTIVASESKPEVSMVFLKQEDASSARRYVSDSDSLGNHSSLLEPADSSIAFGPDQSDFSQNEEDDLCRSLFPPPCFFPKLEDGCSDDLPGNGSNWSFPVEGQPSWLWPY